MRPKAYLRPGMRFGRLVVVARSKRAASGKPLWTCRCDCGAERHVLAAQLNRGGTTSCGCRQRERQRGTSNPDGSASPTYVTWQNMIQRCTDPNTACFPRYGGRGISVCERWADFQRFLDDIGERPAGASIERIDNAKGYEPGNCRWATPKEQARNRRSTRLLTHAGRTQPVAAWAEEYGLPGTVLGKRLDRGWRIEDALALPPFPKGKTRPLPTDHRAADIVAAILRIAP